ncbi:MAG: hypothetical protein E7183_00070 [Erysipelotrichaceae bacterium]|nr:hypothetical protein [Erysipelotrichaceae bacterium]
MIRPLNVEFKILVYILIYGIYYFAVSDILVYIVEKKKRNKIFKLIIEIIYLISQLYITYDFCYKLDDGYIPIYFLLFIIIGFLLYYLFMREYFIKCLDFINKILNKVIPYFKHLFYSKTLFKVKFKKIFKKRKNKNQNT